MRGGIGPNRPESEKMIRAEARPKSAKFPPNWPNSRRSWPKSLRFGEHAPDLTDVEPKLAELAHNWPISSETLPDSPKHPNGGFGRIRQSTSHGIGFAEIRVQRRFRGYPSIDVTIPGSGHIAGGPVTTPDLCMCGDWAHGGRPHADFPTSRTAPCVARARLGVPGGGGSGETFVRAKLAARTRSANASAGLVGCGACFASPTCSGTV